MWRLVLLKYHRIIIEVDEVYSISACTLKAGQHFFFSYFQKNPPSREFLWWLPSWDLGNFSSEFNEKLCCDWQLNV